MNITGKTRIFKKEFDGRQMYSTTIGRKNKEGEYENMFVSVKFLSNGKLVDPNIIHNTDIEIKDGFLSFYNSKNGEKLEYIVKEFEGQQEEYEGFQTLDDSDDIPF